MTDIEKLILEKLDDMSLRISGLEQKVDGIEHKVAAIEHKVSCLDQKVTDETSKIMLIIENDISKKIDIIGEGHDFLKQRLEEALQMEKKWESMELELVNLRMDNRKIKDHINIA